MTHHSATEKLQSGQCSLHPTPPRQHPTHHRATAPHNRRVPGETRVCPNSQTRRRRAGLRNTDTRTARRQERQANPETQIRQGAATGRWTSTRRRTTYHTALALACYLLRTASAVRPRAKTAKGQGTHSIATSRSQMRKFKFHPTLAWDVPNPAVRRARRTRTNTTRVGSCTSPAPHRSSSRHTAAEGRTT